MVPETRPTRTCDRCGRPFSVDSLTHASTPSVGAVLAIGNSDPDDLIPVEPTGLVDRRLYCRSCVRRVNVLRGLFMLTTCALLLAVAWIVAQFIF